MIKKNWVYDVEIFPNFFSLSVEDLISGEEREFVIFGERNDLSKLITFIKEEVAWFIGYNSSKYDDIILSYLCKEFSVFDYTVKELTAALFTMSGEIINSQKTGLKLYKNPKVKKYLRPDSWFKSMDLMSMMYFDKKMIGLKKVAVSMKWPKIQDLPKPYDEDVKADELNIILTYNKNDVGITKALALAQKEEITIRIEVGRIYSENLMSASRSGMADILMSKFWSEETGQERREFKDLRTTYDEIILGECISDKVKFKTPVLKDLLNKMKAHKWTLGKDVEYRVHINKTGYDVLLGGLHSVKPPMIIEATDEYELIDLDVE